MATKMIVTDHLDGSADATTVSFSFAGKFYEIDLAKKNQAAMAKALKPYVDGARLAGGPPRRGRTQRKKPSAAAPSAPLADVRAWATENGFEVSSRGRVPNAVLESYAAAH